MITKIEAKPKEVKQQRVAAYARVSTGKDAMLHSLEAQIDYYQNLITRTPGWVLVDVYADEAMTGTTENRPEFQRMLSDCRAGKIDQIITKSISRFARNTVTSLQVVRELKSLGIDVYYEDMRIHTLSAEGELLLTLHAAFAQEESRSASENQKWRIRKGFADGELMCLRTLFGYRIEKDKIEIDPEQAEIVREIFERAINADTLGSIARWLNNSGMKGCYGGKWKASRLRDLVSNEKYKGDALMQKSYVNNHIDKKRMKNRGEITQYYATETHPAILDQATFDAAQEALKNKKREYKQMATSALTGKIHCACCGKNYKRTVNHGHYGWACMTYLEEGKSKCQSKRIPEEVLERIGDVKDISAVYPNILILHMKDGTERRMEWEAGSRSRSWTPEMKAQAAEYARRRKKHGTNSDGHTADQAAIQGENGKEKSSGLCAGQH